MKSLSTLIKYQKTLVDEQRLVLMQAQDRLVNTLQSIANLEAQKKTEQAAAKQHPENAVTLGEFLKRVIQRGRELDKERQIAEAGVNAAREKLTELFEEQKRYEIAEAARRVADEREQLRIETAELD